VGGGAFVKMKKEEIKKRFKEETLTHKMEVKMDNGVYRHLIFSDGSNIMRFELVTFPDYLCYVGDMGSFTFSRIEDMFEFFRGDSINPGYWSEKLEAVGRRCGYEKYSIEKIKEEMMIHFDSWKFERSQEKVDTLEELEDGILNRETEEEALRAVHEYESPAGHTFEDFDECYAKEYTFHYIWCLYAIVWGISEYDKKKADIPF